MLGGLALAALAACQRPQTNGATNTASRQADPNDVARATIPPEAQAFLARNGRVGGVHTTASGLQYQVIRAGPAAGLHPQRSDEVKVNYEGMLLDGQVFDSTYQRGTPAVMPVAGLIPGWVEALQLMRPGDEWRLWLPPTLAYGDAGAGPIPPGSVLVFRLELLDILPAPERIGRG
jgi:peptidylprolyl isomerase/FKBP-type peptidyl-prolyl cis-trans isomerase FklB